MAKFEKDGVTVETSLPREAVRLRSEGFTKVKARPAVKAAEAPKPSK